LRIVVRLQDRPCGGRIVVRPQTPETRRESISNEFQFQALRKWIIDHKRPEADSMLIDEALREMRTGFPNFTRGEVIEAIKRSQSSNDHPWVAVSNSIDWFAVMMEEEQHQQAIDAAEIVKAALQEGVITPQEVELYRRPPPEVSQRVKKTYELAIASLERELKLTRELKRQAEERARTAEEKLATIVPPPPPPPPTTLKGLVITPTIQDAIFQAYASALLAHPPIINERGVPIPPIETARAKQIALERQLEILSEIQAARDEAEAERIAGQLANQDYREVAIAEAKLAKEAAPNLAGFGPLFPGLSGVLLPNAVRVKVTHSDGHVVWSGVVAISTANGIRQGTLRDDPDAKVQFYPPNVKVPEE